MDREVVKLKQAAYRAVKEACEWMIELRNSAPLEGFEPWSDKFVDYKQGIMNTCEGLTAMFVIDDYNRKEDLHIPILDQNTLFSDVKWLISKVEKEGYRGTPYIDYDDTEYFTDAVSYALSTFLAARAITGGTLKQEIEKQIKKCINWLLSNKIEKEGTFAWSWMGLEEMKEKNVDYPPQTYFTYSGIVPLCDVLNNAPELIKEVQSEVIDTLEGAKNFLLKYNREGDGWIAFEPLVGMIPPKYDELNPAPDLIATSQAVLALCYIKNNVKNIRFQKDEEETIHKAVNWIKKIVETKKNLIYKISTYYICRLGGKVYYEGCTPYILLQTLTEYYKAYPSAMSKEAEKLLYGIVQDIISKCWGGPGAGFRHFVDPDPNSEKNILVIYATADAIQSLLNFGVERPPVVNIEDIIKEELMNAQNRIFERLKESGIELEISVYGDEEEEIIPPEMKDNLNLGYDQMFMKISSNLTKKDLDTWATYGKDANVTRFLELFEKNYRENDSETFKANISRFEDGHSIVLLEPQKKALSLLKNFTKDEIENKKVRGKKMKEVLEQLNKEIENFLKK